MRIFLSLIGSASSGANDSMWKNIFVVTLKNLGHEVVFVDIRNLVSVYSRNNLKEASEKLIDKFNYLDSKKSFDLILTYYNDEQFDSDYLTGIRDSVLKVNYNTNFHQVDKYKKSHSNYDVSLYASIEAKEYYNEKCKNSFYLPFASRTPVGFNEKKKNQIAFAGTKYGQRPQVILRILQKNLPLTYSGYGWEVSRLDIIKRFAATIFYSRNQTSFNNSISDLQRDSVAKYILEMYSDSCAGVLSDDAYQSLFYNSLIGLNIPESRFNHEFMHSNKLLAANLRDFEIPGFGSMLLTQFNKEIAGCFKEGVEAEFYRGEDEMLDKLKFYVNNSSSALKIAKAGHSKIAKAHTWNHRFELLFHQLQSL